MDAKRSWANDSKALKLKEDGLNLNVMIAKAITMGDEWFTEPVNTSQGLFFTGYSQDDENPDIGDSAITET